MFLASLSSCHMLWFLHFCSEASVIVLEYTDSATGIMIEFEDGNGKFAEVILHPKVRGEGNLDDRKNNCFSMTKPMSFVLLRTPVIFRSDMKQ